MNMTAKHATWPDQSDIVFEIAGKAKKAEEKYGKENVINATLGVLTQDDGTLVTFDTVYDVYKKLPPSELAAYSPLEGIPDFLNYAENDFFGEFRPDAYIRAVATPGGSGAVKHALWCYTDPGNEVLTSDWYWKPYDTFADEIDRKITTYSLFDDNENFNIKSFCEKAAEILKKQERILIIINTPAHNPTGFSLSVQDWKKIIRFLKKQAENKEKKITVLIDTAYIEFAEKDDCNTKEIFRELGGCSENIFFIIGFSASKSYTMYGLRCGAAIGVSSSKEVTDEFFVSCVHSGRANWSNSPRGAMSTIAEIEKDKDLKEKYEAEKEEYRNLLQKRAYAFVKESQKTGLKILPYRAGFFITIPCDNPKSVCEELADEKVFVVPLDKGLRFAACAISEEKCRKAPEFIKKAVEKFSDN